MTNATFSLHRAPLYVPPAITAAWSKDTSADGVMDQSTSNYAYIMYLVGNAPCSPQSPLLWSSLHFVFYNLLCVCVCVCVSISKRLYDQLTSGFRIPNFSGFRILYQCRFWIPIHWIPDSGFCYMGNIYAVFSFSATCTTVQLDFIVGCSVQP